jgi:SAM-dependent methyltransferase
MARIGLPAHIYTSTIIDVISRGADLFRLLGDATRLRLLRVLARDRFNVTELTGILGVAQSGVSRHLGLLREAGLVIEERNGGYAFYRLAERTAAHAKTNGTVAALWPLLDAQFAASAHDRAVKADEARLQEVLRLRHENFDTHGDVRQLVPGRSWAAWARALGHLLPALDVADLGCGEGYLTIEAARWARSVVAVDRSEDVLERARDLARRRRVSNIVWKRGDLVKLPIDDGSVDLALLSQTLHHSTRPERVLTEAVRICRPGGKVLVLDLREHDQAWVRERLGDERLGFGDAELERLLRGAGLSHVRVTVGTRRTGDPFTVLIASGSIPKSRSSAKGHDDRH